MRTFILSTQLVIRWNQPGGKQKFIIYNVAFKDAIKTSASGNLSFRGGPFSIPLQSTTSEPLLLMRTNSKDPRLGTFEFNVTSMFGHRAFKASISSTARRRYTCQDLQCSTAILSSFPLMSAISTFASASSPFSAPLSSFSSASLFLVAPFGGRPLRLV